MFHQILLSAGPWLEHYGYLALFVAVFVEGFGVPAPGQTFIIGATLLAQRGELHVETIAVTAWSAAVLGDNLGYIIGRQGGTRLLRRLHFPQQHVQSITSRFRRYGGWIVMFARFVDILRQLNGLVAGSLQMPWARFLIYNAVGAALWVGLWAYGIYYLDARLTRLLHNVHLAYYWIGLLSVVGVGILTAWWLFHRRRGRR